MNTHVFKYDYGENFSEADHHSNEVSTSLDSSFQPREVLNQNPEIIHISQSPSMMTIWMSKDCGESDSETDEESNKDTAALDSHFAHTFQPGFREVFDPNPEIIHIAPSPSTMTNSTSKDCGESDSETDEEPNGDTTALDSHFAHTFQPGFREVFDSNSENIHISQSPSTMTNSMSKGCEESDSETDEVSNEDTAALDSHFAHTFQTGFREVFDPNPEIIHIAPSPSTIMCPMCKETVPLEKALEHLNTRHEEDFGDVTQDKLRLLVDAFEKDLKTQIAFKVNSKFADSFLLHSIYCALIITDSILGI